MGELVPLESAIVRRICQLLDKRGAWYVKTTGVSKVGCPDLLVCYRGRFLAFEVKRAPKQGYGATKKQLLELHRIRDADGVALVVFSEVEVRNILNTVDEAEDATGEM